MLKAKQHAVKPARPGLQSLWFSLLSLKQEECEGWTAERTQIKIGKKKKKKKTSANATGH